MNISMIEMVSSHGGMNYYDYALLNAFGMLGNKVTLFTSENLVFDASKNRNVTVSYVYKNLFKGNKISKLFHYIYGTLKTVKQIKKDKAEIAHFQVFAVGILEVFVVWLLKLCKLKTIVTIHDVESFSTKNKKFLFSYFYKNVNGIIVHNKASYDVLCSQVGEFCKSADNYIQYIKKSHIVHHGSYIGLLPAKISKKLAKQKFALHADDFIFLFFGQIKTVKGLDVLLEAYAKLLESVNGKVKLIVAGKVWKTEWKPYEVIIEKYKLTHHILLDIKYIPDNEIVYYYSAADCVVLPYKKIFQSGVLLMAQSYQVPVIVSDLPGMTEIITDRKNGFVFKSEDSDDLYKKMKQCMEMSYEETETMLSCAYKKLQSEYDWNHIAQQQLEIMHAL